MWTKQRRKQTNPDLCKIVLQLRASKVFQNVNPLGRSVEAAKVWLQLACKHDGKKAAATYVCKLVCVCVHEQEDLAS